MQAIELFEATPLDGKNYNLNLAASTIIWASLAGRCALPRRRDYDRALALCHGSGI